MKGLDRDTHEVIDGLAADGKAGGAVRHEALTLGETDLLAKIALEPTNNKTTVVRCLR